MVRTAGSWGRGGGEGVGGRGGEGGEGMVARVAWVARAWRRLGSRAGTDGHSTYWTVAARARARTRARAPSSCAGVSRGARTRLVG